MIWQGISTAAFTALHKGNGGLQLLVTDLTATGALVAHRELEEAIVVWKGTKPDQPSAILAGDHCCIWVTPDAEKLFQVSGGAPAKQRHKTFT